MVQLSLLGYSLSCPWLSIASLRDVHAKFISPSFLLFWAHLTGILISIAAQVSL